MNSAVDKFFANSTQWKIELAALRKIILGFDLTEELKWNKPCYMFQDTNIISLTPLKESCALAFFKGALLKDPNNILIKPGEHTQSGRWIKFTSLKQIKELEKILKAYIQEAIEVEKSGLKVIVEAKAGPELPVELQNILKANRKFNSAFYSLTPGRQRGYAMFFSAPKQSSTRTLRVEKYMERILDGKGLNDCTCGLSKKMPACDGSHKYLKITD
jgi:uncharacterized protein YdeI (YjbR/CyaY-like superfamily)